MVASSLYYEVDDDEEHAYFDDDDDRGDGSQVGGGMNDVGKPSVFFRENSQLNLSPVVLHTTVEVVLRAGSTRPSR